MEKIKVFISQPMRNKTNEEIEKERNDIKASAKWVYEMLKTFGGKLEK